MTLVSVLSLTADASSLDLWRNLRDGKGDLDAYTSFLKRHAHWPDKSRIVGHGEKKLLDSQPSPARDVQWFQNYPPTTSKGWLRYLDAQAARKANKETMSRLARQAWHIGVDIEHEAEFYKKWSRYLGVQDHTEREYRLMMLGSSSPIARKQKAKIYPCALAYQKVRSQLKSKNYDDAYRLLKKHLKEARLVTPRMAEAWWKTCHAVARECLEKNQWQEGLELISHHDLPEGSEDWANAEWTRGWFMWHLAQYTQALQVFAHAYDKVKAPTSRSRMAFWAAESARSAGLSDKSEAWHKKSAQYACSFYGQLSVRFLGQGMPNLFWPDDVGSHVSLKKNEFYQLLFHNHDLNKEELLLFFQVWIKELHRSHAPTDPIFAFVVRFSHEKGGDAIATAVMRLINFVSPLFVRKAFPTLPGVGGAVATIANAIAWRESGFDPNAISHAGAIGLMQIMPGTFDLEKKKMGTPPSGTLHTPEANVIVGTHLINRLMTEYPNIILTLSAYNAGEDPVNRWRQVFGDPPAMEADPVLVADWIEKIPYYETRNYVQRVLEKVHVYQLLLSNQ